MKKVEALFKPFRLAEIKDKLHEAGIDTGMTTSEVKGHGHQHKGKKNGDGGDHDMAFCPKIKIEMILPDELVERVVEIIVQSCKSGHHGDGKIFIQPIEAAYRIRTEEVGNQAL